MRAGLIGLTMLLLATVLGGCSSSPKRPAVLPSAEAIVEAHNTRVEGITSLWARTSVRVEGRDAEGSRFSEQGEGHLQVERPERVAVTVGKLGEVYFALGSNETHYWLVDVSDAERRVMLIGDQELATPEKAAQLGLPVHPRDLPMLMGLLPLDATVVRGPEADAGGNAEVRVSTRWGEAALRYDPVSLELVGAAAFDGTGGLVAEAVLSRTGDVQVGTGLLVAGRLPTRVEVRVPGFDGFVRMELGEPRVRSINATVFSPDRLEKAYRVRTVVDLDVPTGADEGTGG